MKEWNINTHNISESQMHYVKWKEPPIWKYMCYESILRLGNANILWAKEKKKNQCWPGISSWNKEIEGKRNQVDIWVTEMFHILIVIVVKCLYLFVITHRILITNIPEFNHTSMIKNFKLTPKIYCSFLGSNMVTSLNTDFLL